MQPNRREHVRHFVAVAAEVEVSGHVWEGETHDISQGGVAVAMDIELQEGSDVDVSLILTQDGIEDPSEDPFETSAKVIWTAPSDAGHWMTGLRFEKLPAEAEAQLGRFLKALESDTTA